jgi:K+-transporting ATPase KdpF subunit
MGPDSLIGGLIALAILVYLMYSLFIPERF